jgi:hypothetical protein
VSPELDGKYPAKPHPVKTASINAIKPVLSEQSEPKDGFVLVNFAL